MNSAIDEINSYPFERLRNLIDAKQANGEINLSIGEPKHEANPKAVSYTHLTLPTILLV